MSELRSCDLRSLEEMMQQLQQPSFRAKQIFGWVHQKNITDITQMSNIGKNLLAMLQNEHTLGVMQLEKRQVSADGTEKYLFRLSDGEFIECVLMRYRGDMSKARNTLCVSSQVGCAMGCIFCATGQSGLVRNLSVGEIVGQVYEVNALLGEKMPVGNVVFMGMGEPLLNLDNVLKAIELLNDVQGQNIGIRRMTISTCGIVPQIARLAQAQKDFVLAISLHAPNDELRSQIMPINEQYPLAMLMNACREYQRVTKKRLSFEYALIKGFNDQEKHIKQLEMLLKGLDCHLNVIPVNPVAGAGHFQKPSREYISRFVQGLKKVGVNASIREEKGKDIDGACGQLRGKIKELS